MVVYLTLLQLTLHGSWLDPRIRTYVRISNGKTHGNISEVRTYIFLQIYTHIIDKYVQ